MGDEQQEELEVIYPTITTPKPVVAHRYPFLVLLPCTAERLGSSIRANGVATLSKERAERDALL